MDSPDRLGATAEMASGGCCAPGSARREAGDGWRREDGAGSLPSMACAAQDGEMTRAGPAAGRPAKDGPAELFPAEDVGRTWTVARRVGAGLQNLGNTCFMNSVLQCLTHTPPLAEALLRAKLPHGPHRGLDALRAAQEHVAKALQGRFAVFAPVALARSLKQLNRSFRTGRQEDAHEYLVALLDAMHESLLAPLRPRPPPALAQTSLIFRIFAGRVRSMVRCGECGYESATSDAFLDVSLEVNRAASVEKALARFTATEHLEGENKYRCPQQRCLVRAAKRMAFEAAPAVLLLHLKRFEYSLYGQKITKKVDYGTRLDLAPYMAARRSPPLLYELYAVLVHTGHSVHSGHYYCYVRAPNGLWHQMDDSSVSQVSERVVLAQKAYILFYMRCDLGPGMRPAAAAAVSAAAAAHARKPQLQPQPPKTPPGKRAAPEQPPEPAAAAKRARSGSDASAPAEDPAAVADGNAAAGDGAAAAGSAAANGTAGGSEDGSLLRERRASHAAAGPARPQKEQAGQQQQQSPQPRPPPPWMADPGPPPGAAQQRGRVEGGSPPPAAEADFGSLGSPFGNGKAPRPTRLHTAASSSLLGRSHRRLATMVIKDFTRSGSHLLAPPAGASPLRRPEAPAHPPGLSPLAKLGDGSEGAPPLNGRSRAANGRHRPGSDAGSSGSEGDAPQPPLQPDASGGRQRSTTDPEQVRDVLGLAERPRVAGPAGEAVWDDVPGAVRGAAVAAQPREREERRRRERDEYDREYDRGRTKKVRGPKGAPAWRDGNAFQHASDRQRHRRDSSRPWEGGGGRERRESERWRSPGRSDRRSRAAAR